MRPERALRVLHVTVGLVVGLESGQTLIHALSDMGGAGHVHLAAMAGVELAAALLFLWPPTLRVGGIALLLVFAAALLVHAGRGEFEAPLLVYAAAALYVTVHGGARPAARPPAVP